MTEPTPSVSPALPMRHQDILVADSVAALDEAITVLGALPDHEYSAASPVGSINRTRSSASGRRSGIGFRRRNCPRKKINKK